MPAQQTPTIPIHTTQQSCMQAQSKSLFPIFFSFLTSFFFFSGHTRGMCRFLGQGQNWCHSCSLCHRCGNTGSVTRCATRELPLGFFLTSFWFLHLLGISFFLEDVSLISASTLVSWDLPTPPSPRWGQHSQDTVSLITLGPECRTQAHLMGNT